jgi:Restriction endonuclease
MARRGSQIRDLKVPAIIGLSIFFIWIIVGLLDTASKALNVPVKFILFGTTAVVFGSLVGLWAYGSTRARRARQTLLGKVYDATEYHLSTLTRRRAQLVQLDPYGRPKFEKWQKELAQFISTHIEPLLSNIERSVLQREPTLIWHIIESTIHEESNRNPVFHAFSATMTPFEFENFCAEQLRLAGWTAWVTTESGDQGTDVVAEKGHVRAVFQCKLYSVPVGNKAVQEAAAGRLHEGAQYAFVVSNNDYTRSARQLAASTDVRLIHHTDLRNLDRILNLKR